MALLKCTECGAAISDKATACVKCGAPPPAASTLVSPDAAARHTKERKKAKLYFAAIVFGVVGVLFVGAWVDRDKPRPPELQRLTFTLPSIPMCVAFLEKQTGGLLTIKKDGPDETSGTLADGNSFGCTKRETGSRGTYIEGWYYGNQVPALEKPRTK